MLKDHSEDHPVTQNYLLLESVGQRLDALLNRKSEIPGSSLFPPLTKGLL